MQYNHLRPTPPVSHTCVCVYIFIRLLVCRTLSYTHALYMNYSKSTDPIITAQVEQRSDRDTVLYAREKP